VSAGVLGQSDDEPIERGLLEGDVRRDVGILVVVDEEGNS